MKYEYKSIVLTGGYDVSYLSNDHAGILNKYFFDGWEYVDSITQAVALGGSVGNRPGPVLVILRKENNSITL